MTNQQARDSDSTAWSNDADTLARTLWASGHSAGQISRALALSGIHKTRSAVVGYLSRRGLSRSPSATKATVALGHIESKRLKPKPVTPAKAFLPRIAPAAPKAPSKPVAVMPLALPDVEPGQCKLEVSPGKFCALPTERVVRGRRAPYCSQCSKVIYVRKAV